MGLTTVLAIYTPGWYKQCLEERLAENIEVSPCYCTAGVTMLMHRGMGSLREVVLRWCAQGRILVLAVVTAAFIAVAFYGRTTFLLGAFMAGMCMPSRLLPRHLHSY